MTQNDPKKGPSGQLDLTMVGTLEEHLGKGVAFLVLITDLGEFGLEDLIGHGAGILEFAQAVVGKDVQVAIRNDFFECRLTLVGDAVNGRVQPCEDVSRPIVELVTIEVVCMEGLHLSFGVDIGRAFSIESVRHKDMAGVDALTQTRVCRTSSVRILGRRKSVLRYLPIGFQEIPVRVSVADVVFREHQRHLFDDTLRDERL